jgi:hypothetical protein
VTGQGESEGRFDERGRLRALLAAPILRALAALGLSAVASAGAIQALWRLAGIDLPLGAKLALAGVLAAALGALFRLPRWWLLLLALAPAALVGAIRLDLPAWAYVLAFAAGVLLLFNSAGERVPLFLTGRASKRALADLIEADRPIAAVDLGCGLGGPMLALAAANRAPDSRFLGVETAPVPFAIAWARARMTRDPRLSVRYRSLWSVDLGAFDLVYAFLSPAPMPRLMAKARAEMCDGALFVSNEFTDPSYPPDRTIDPKGVGGRPLHVWRIPFASERAVTTK